MEFKAWPKIARFENKRKPVFTERLTVRMLAL